MPSVSDDKGKLGYVTGETQRPTDNDPPTCMHSSLQLCGDRLAYRLHGTGNRKNLSMLTNC